MNIKVILADGKFIAVDGEQPLNVEVVDLHKENMELVDCLIKTEFNKNEWSSEMPDGYISGIKYEDIGEPIVRALKAYLKALSKDQMIDLICECANEIDSVLYSESGSIIHQGVEAGVTNFMKRLEEKK